MRCGFQLTGAPPLVLSSGAFTLTKPEAQQALFFQQVPLTIAALQLVLPRPSYSPCLIDPWMSRSTLLTQRLSVPFDVCFLMQQLQVCGIQL